MATDAIGLVAVALEGETGKMLLAVVAAKVFCVEGLFAHHDALARGDGHAARGAEEALLLVVVRLAVRQPVLAGDKAERLEGLLAHGALEAALVPHLAHRLDLRLVLDRRVARAAHRRERVRVVSCVL